MHSVGNVGVRVSNYVSNNDKARTNVTVKETTPPQMNGWQMLEMVYPGSGYLTNSQTPANTQRTTTTQGYFGPSGNTQTIYK